MNSNKQAWVALTLIPHIGPRSILKLLEIFKGPEEILHATRSELVALNVLKQSQLKALTSGPDMDEVGKTLKKLDSIGADIIVLSDPEYPDILKEISDPPPVLYVKGDISDIQPAVAMVGTRAPSHYGKEVAHSIARDLSIRGISIVSGMARGIDTLSHTGALKGSAKTVAVLGSGLDIIYPAENKELSEQIASKGALISEFPPGTKPDAKNFPIRNRIISGLSLGVIVAEATIKSGAMITARLAGEQGKFCMAVPGAVTNVRSQGPHSLIRQGAILVRDADDILMEILPQVQTMVKTDDKNAEQPTNSIKDVVSGQELTIEEIASEIGKGVKETSKMITMLELNGEIIRIKGNKFTAKSVSGKKVALPKAGKKDE
ncbi:MAG: DNA-processing protein DprA [Thermodesulfobacteriota bacterium]|nr:DNA-processing protein DprA [Thermodesulfobacteriota bacterium]